MSEENLDELRSNKDEKDEEVSMNEEENPNPDEMPIEEEVKFDEPNME